MHLRSCCSNATTWFTSRKISLEFLLISFVLHEISWSTSRIWNVLHDFKVLHETAQSNTPIVYNISSAKYIGTTDGQRRFNANATSRSIITSNNLVVNAFTRVYATGRGKFMRGIVFIEPTKFFEVLHGTKLNFRLPICRLAAGAATSCSCWLCAFAASVSCVAVTQCHHLML